MEDAAEQERYHKAGDSCDKSAKLMVYLLLCMALLGTDWFDAGSP